jgi:hypothetical protein
MALAWTSSATCLSAALGLAGSITNIDWFFEVSDRLRF